MPQRRSRASFVPSQCHDRTAGIGPLISRKIAPLGWRGAAIRNEDRHSGLGKGIVLIARNHMARARDSGVDRAWDKRAESGQALVAHHVAHSPADQMHRQVEVRGSARKRPDRVRRGAPKQNSVNKTGIPMPAKSAIGTRAQITPEAVNAPGPRFAGRVSSDCGSCILDRGEPLLQMRAHEIHHATDTRSVQVGRDIDESEGSERAGSLLPFRNQSRQTAQRSADQVRANVQLACHRNEIGGEIVDGVSSVRRPRAFTVPAQIKRHSLETCLGEEPGRASPGAACLPASVRQQHRNTIWLAHNVGNECLAVSAGKDDLLHDFPP